MGKTEEQTRIYLYACFVACSISSLAALSPYPISKSPFSNPLNTTSAKSSKGAPNVCNPTPHRSLLTAGGKTSTTLPFVLDNCSLRLIEKECNAAFVAL